MTTSVKECDYLDQDPSLRGQSYVCVSFISPEDAIKQKEVFNFHKFTQAFAKDLSELFSNVKNKFKEDKETLEMFNSLQERYDYLFSVDNLEEAYKFFKDNNADALETEYTTKNGFQTSIRGFKVRGSYASIEEAKNRAQAIRKFDKNFNVYIAEVGCWCPWSPNPDDISDQEYTETQLNTLMKQYKQNQEDKDAHYRIRQQDMIGNANKNSSLPDEASSSTVPDILSEDPWLENKKNSAPQAKISSEE